MTPEELETKVMDAICDIFSLRDRCGGYRCEQCRREAKVIIPLILEAAAKACDGVAADVWTRIGGEHEKWMRATAEDCASAVRALKGAGDVQQA